MKLHSTTSLILLYLASFVTAAPVDAAAIGSWTLKLTNTKGGTYNMHGHEDVGCNTIELENKYQMKHADYDDNVFTRTFELYAQKDCKGAVSYRNNKDSYELHPPRMIHSYKVY